MEPNDQLHSSGNSTSNPYHSNSQSHGLLHRSTASPSPSEGVDETASLQAEIAALDRERQLLLLRQQRDAKRIELDRLRAFENVDTSTTPSINVASHASLPSPASSSAEVVSRPKESTGEESYGVAGPHEQVPPPYSTSMEPAIHQTRALSPLRGGHHPPQTTHLVKPIAIPATSAKLGSPFMRAYPTTLDTYGINRTDFLGFLDDLNRCAVASPPVQILGLAGNIVSFVPLQTAQIVGSSVNLAASAATIGVSKGRTELCLRAANTALFAPRGLKAEIAKLDALAKIAAMPSSLWDPATGKLNKKASLLAPIGSLEEAQSQSAQQRRLQALESWIAPLDLAPLPEVKQSDNVLGKLHTMASENQRRKEEKKMLKDRSKAFGEGGKVNREVAKAEKEFEKDMHKLDDKEEQVRLKEAGSSGKLEKELAKIEKERTKLVKEREREMGKLEEARRKDDKEEDSLRKILWLIIRNVEDPSGPGPNPNLESPGPSPL